MAIADPELPTSQTKSIKVYESAYTYFPFVYLLTITSLYGSIYHSEFDYLKPWVILSFTLFNTFVYVHHKRKTIVLNILHKNIWKTCTLAFYGILINNTHDCLFAGLHYVNPALNLVLSALYILLINYFTYVAKREDFVLYVHIVMFYFPIQHVWQINLYLYVLFVSISVAILYARCPKKVLLESSIHLKSVLRFYAYLRIADPFIVIGPAQLYAEYCLPHWDDIRLLRQVNRIIKTKLESSKVESIDSLDLHGLCQHNSNDTTSEQQVHDHFLTCELA